MVVMFFVVSLMMGLFIGGHCNCDVCWDMDYSIDSPYITEEQLDDLIGTVYDYLADVPRCSSPQSVQCPSNNKCFTFEMTIEMDSDYITMEMTSEARSCAIPGMFADDVFDDGGCFHIDELSDLAYLYPDIDPDSLTFGLDYNSLGINLDIDGSICVCTSGSCSGDSINLPPPLKCPACADVDVTGVPSSYLNGLSLADCDYPVTETCSNYKEVCAKVSMDVSFEVSGVTYEGTVRLAGCAGQDDVPADVWNYGCHSSSSVLQSTLEELGLQGTVSNLDVCLCDADGCTGDIRNMQSVSGGGDGSGGWDGARAGASQTRMCSGLIIAGISALLTIWA